MSTTSRVRLGLIWCFLAGGLLASSVVQAATTKRAPITVRDFFIPSQNATAEWRLLLGGGLFAPLQSEDSYSPLGLPMELQPQLIIYDEYKRIQSKPMTLFFQLLENGRSRVFESFTYGIDLANLSFDVHLHPRLHLHYTIGLYQTSLRHHVGGAGIVLDLGVRIPLWFKSFRPREYDRAHLHLVLLPVRLLFLGRIDEPDLTGFDAFRPVINGSGGLAFAYTFLPWLQANASISLFWNYTELQSVLFQSTASVQASLTPWLSLRASFHNQVPIRQVNIRTNLYQLYFHRYISIGGTLHFVFHIHRTKPQKGETS